MLLSGIWWVALLKINGHGGFFPPPPLLGRVVFMAAQRTRFYDLLTAKSKKLEIRWIRTGNLILHRELPVIIINQKSLLKLLVIVIEAGWNIIRMLPSSRNRSRKCNPARLTNITHLTLNTNMVRNSKQCFLRLLFDFSFSLPHFQSDLI